MKRIELTVLYVEDNITTREITALALERMFQQVWVGVNGAEGLAMYDKFKPDIIITDVAMPELDGISMAKTILNRNPGAVIILLSAANEITKVEDALCAGVTGYLIQPVMIDDLERLLRRCVDKVAWQRIAARLMTTRR